MRIWLVSFLVLLALARGLDWLHNLTLPFPMLLLGGAILSILSNESTLAGLPWIPKSQPSQPETTKNSLQCSAYTGKGLGGSEMKRAR